jgi:predicted dehydrogenase
MKTYQVGIAGYGWVASAHIPALQATGRARIAAVCSSRPLDEQTLAAKHGGPITLHRRFEDLVADPGIDVISLCGLPSLHARQAILAAEAGKHLIIEKPVALTLPDLRAVQAAVARSGVRTCVGFECRYSSQFRATKAVLDRGLLGALHYGEVDYYHGIGPWYGQFRWCAGRENSGSSLLNAGCHAMDALLLCLGDEVVEVSSFASKSANPVFAPYEYPSTSVTLLKFRHGAVGKCASSIDCLQPYYFHTHLLGSKGSLLDNKFHSADLATDKAAWNTIAMKMLDSGDVADHPYEAQFAAFFAALDEGRDMPLTSLADAARSHEVIFAADHSAATGRPVKLAEFL